MTGFAPLVFPAPQEAVQAAEALVAPNHAPIPTLAPGARLAAALKQLRWTYGTLAVELGLSPSTTRNWGLGRAPCPPDVLRWVELLADFHRHCPRPR